MESRTDRQRSSQWGSAALIGMISALIAVVLFKMAIGLTFAAALVVAVLTFILSGALVLRQTRR